MAIKHRRVAIGHLSWMVEHNDLGSEVSNTRGGLVLGIRGDVTSLDVLHGDILDVETHIVPGAGLGQGLVVHLDRLNLSGEGHRSEGDHHARLDHTSLNSANWDCPNSSNLVHILKGQPEGFVSGSAWGNDGVKGLKEGHSTGLALLPLNIPTLVPGHVGGCLDHVIAMPARDWHKGHGGRIVTNLLDEASHLLVDFLKPSLRVGRLSGVHLIHSNNQLLHTQGVGQQSMLPGLSILGNASLKLSSS